MNFFKKIVVLVCLLMIDANISSAKESEIVYVNKNGVSFTGEQYDFYSDMFWNGYQDYVTKDDFQYAKSLNIFNAPIEKKASVLNFFDNTYAPYSTKVNQNSRILEISKSCTTQCYVSLQASWTAIPNIASYDILGVRLSGTKLVRVNTAYAIGTNYSFSSSTPQTFSNGFGYSLKISSVSNLRVYTSFYTTTGGTIYGSYQHAKSNTSLSISEKYNIGIGGFGGVFNFYDEAANIYDNSNGVVINL